MTLCYTYLGKCVFVYESIWDRKKEEQGMEVWAVLLLAAGVPFMSVALKHPLFSLTLKNKKAFSTSPSSSVEIEAHAESNEHTISPEIPSAKTYSLC